MVVKKELAAGLDGMKRKHIAALLSCVLLAGCGPSAEDKGRIRQFISAYSRLLGVYRTQSIFSDPSQIDPSLTVDLQKAADLVTDSRARQEILRCQDLIDTYAIKRRTQFLALSADFIQLKIRNPRRPQEDNLDDAKKAAEKEVQLPDIYPMARCAEITLPPFTK
jgi:hypothetical protein